MTLPGVLGAGGGCGHVRRGAAGVRGGGRPGGGCGAGRAGGDAGEPGGAGDAAGLGAAAGVGVAAVRPRRPAIDGVPVPVVAYQDDGTD